VDEPQGCTDFYTFRVLLYERYHWDQMMKHYFKKYVLPHIRGAGVNIALAKTFFIFWSIFLAKVNVFTGSSRNRARQPLKTVCVNYSAQHFVTTSRSVDGRRDGSGPKALISVAQKNAIMRAVV
jgi:hypothetical protein